MFNEIAKQFPQIEFTWIGDGELKSELTSDNITITGWLERSEVLKILNKNDIFILTSLWEGLPISLLEAMYMKKICIVSNIIGNRDVIEDGKNGFVANNLENYRKIILQIKNDDYLEISTEARKCIINKFNNDIMIKKYINLYGDN